MCDVWDGRRKCGSRASLRLLYPQGCHVKHCVSIKDLWALEWRHRYALGAPAQLRGGDCLWRGSYSNPLRASPDGGGDRYQQGAGIGRGSSSPLGPSFALHTEWHACLLRQELHLDH